MIASYLKKYSNVTFTGNKINLNKNNYSMTTHHKVNKFYNIYYLLIY